MELKERIVQRAEELFMRYGIRSVTMDDLARDLGISKKTLYQFVENKVDLIEQIMELHIYEEHSSIDHISKQAADAIEAILNIAQYVTDKIRCISPTIIYDLKKYYKECWDKMEGLHRDFVYSRIRTNLQQGIAQGLYRTDLNIDIVAKLFVGKTTLVTDEELFPLEEYDQETLFREYMNLHIHGIASPKGLQLLELYQQK